MKKFATLLLSAAMVVTLAGCGTTPSLRGNNASDSTSNSSTVQPGYPDEYGDAEGYLNDTMHTYFFDYTVESAYLCDEYEGYTPQEGYELLVADVTVTNTFKETIEMYDTDFQVQWNDTSDDAYDAPITYYVEDAFSDKVLPGTYKLGIKESRSGVLVFEVPAGNSDFSISYQEYFSDDSTGNVFFVYFSANKQ